MQRQSIFRADLPVQFLQKIAYNGVAGPMIKIAVRDVPDTLDIEAESTFSQLLARWMDVIEPYEPLQRLDSMRTRHRLSVEDRQASIKRIEENLRSARRPPERLNWDMPTTCISSELQERHTLNLRRRGASVAGRFSAAAVVIRFWNSFNPNARKDIRKFVVHEDHESAAYPECHAHGFIPIWKESPKICIGRRVSLSDVVLTEQRVRRVRYRHHNGTNRKHYRRLHIQQ